MNRNHWIIMVVIVAVAYLAGVKYPAWGTKALSAVGA
jgi:hypothetical protein